MNFTSSRQLVEVLLSPKQLGISSPIEMQVFLVFGLILQNLKLICVIGIVQIYLGF